MSISISGLTRQFGTTPVLQGIDLDVAKGELVALLGPSGSGKTTLLRIIAGLDWPDAGRLVVAGQDWLQLGARDRRTGFVFQHYALFPHMNVRDNIAFGLTVGPRDARPGKAQIRARVDHLLELLQIPHLADRFPGQLSGGQRQRVALGRAMAIEPAVLLLDEPFGALDAAVRRDLRIWLREVHERTGSTTIFVTHDQEEAFELADRIIVMDQGRIAQAGTADQIHDHPATPFVARFTGAVIELPVILRAGRIEAEGIDAGLLPRRALADGQGSLLLRPDVIELAPDEGSPWVITGLGSTGAELHFRLQGPSGATLSTVSPRHAPGARDLRTGTHVRLRPLTGAVFVNNPAAGAAPQTASVERISRERQA